METAAHLDALRPVGGNLALDFLNTQSGPPGGPPDHEGLRAYDDLVAWAVRAGSLAEPLGRRLLERAGRRPAEGRAALARAVGVRGDLAAVFTAVAAGRRPPTSALKALHGAELEALAAAELALAAQGAAWSWAGDERLTRPLGPVVHAAVELLLRGPLERVKACAGCSFLFLDDSKNRSRRWCSMDDCGTAEKMRRYVARRAAARR